MIRNITCFGETYSPEEYIEKELLYDLYQYASMTEEEMEQMRKE